MRTMIKRSLKKGGVEAEILEAGDGVQGLEQVTDDMDVILCDWNMPHMDGLEFVRQLRSRRNTTPIIMVTTETRFEKQRVAKSAGVSDFIAKPFTPEQLCEMIQQTITA